MKPSGFHRLHALRMENDARGYEMDAMRPRFDALARRHEEGTAPRAVVSFNLFQTPPDLAARMVALAGITPAHSVLEPSAGLGRLLRPILGHGPRRVVAVDISPDCLREVFNDFPTVEISQGDFLGKNLGKFDRVVMNPPFKQGQDIRHILHARAHLAPGGRLVAICAAGPRQQEKLAPICREWIDLPAGSFRSEGTGVASAIVIFDAPAA